MTRSKLHLVDGEKMGSAQPESDSAQMSTEEWLEMRTTEWKETYEGIRRRNDGEI